MDDVSNMRPLDLRSKSKRPEEQRRVRFCTLPTMDGYDIISEDNGRPIASRATRREANGVAQTLNSVAIAELGGVIARLRR